MPSLLDSFELKLEQHFRALSAERKAVGYPIFALEHGLTPVEVQRLEESLREGFLIDGLNEAHWLVWVVYAAEQGYNYHGEEYWHSFEDRTKSWRQNGDRQQIRLWFEKFRDTYFGACPTGIWASHFSIISWPITHAVLPHDLQGQLARSLYNARYRLGDIKSMSAKKVGQLIALSSHEPSSRFRFFLGQEEFVGQIVLALLNQETGSVGPLLPLTLERIVSDLNKIRTAREWLHDARQAHARPHFRMSALREVATQDGVIDHPQKIDNSLISAVTDRQILLRPVLMARRELHDRWAIDIAIPNFQPIASLSIEYASFIRSTRLSIPCTGSSRLPAGWLLSGLRQREVSSWPDDGECLIQFEKTPTPFDEILKAECQLVPGPIWLFKLNQVGGGQLLLGRTLQPERRYLLISRDAISLGKYVQSCSIACDGLYGVILTLPNQVTTELSTSLKAIGLTVTRSITIEPVGFIPRQWDGEGQGEWLVNEEPCFAITRDHDFDSYELKLDDAERLTISCGSNAGPILVRLGLLSSGRHVLTIQTKLLGKVIAQRNISIFIRQSSIWIPGTLSHAGMLVDVTPNEPSIDDLLDGAVELEILGDPSRHAKCSVVLVDSLGKELDRHVVMEHRFPITRNIWSKSLTEFIKASTDLQYLRASSAYVLIDGEDLGEYRIPLEGHHGPLRWFFQKRKDDMYLRLINDGDDEGLTTFFYDFRRPFEKTALDSVDCIHGIKINEPGGLFIAEKNGIKHFVVVAPIKIKGGLWGLQCEIDLASLEACTDVRRLLNVAAAWRQATLSGIIAGNRRNQALAALEDRVFELICGNDWISAERKVRNAPSKESAWGHLEEAVGKQISFAIALTKAWRDNISKDETFLKKRFIEISAKFKICKDTKLAESAWLVAFDPHNIITKPEEERGDLLHAVENNKTLVRGARLLFLCRKFRSATITNHS